MLSFCERDRCPCIDRGLSWTSRCHDTSAKYGGGETVESFVQPRKSSPGATAYPCITTRPGEDVHVVKKGFVNIHEFKDFGHDLRSEHLNKAMSSRRATEAYMNESRFNKLIRVQALVGAQTYVPQRDRTRTLCNQSCDGLYSQQSLDAK